MAKLCIYCEQLLPDDNARFCNRCGRTQVPSPDSTIAPSPIKVKLPPKEFSRSEIPAAWQEKITPGSTANETRLPQREQSAPDSSRLQKRPTRLAPSEPVMEQVSAEASPVDVPPVQTAVSQQEVETLSTPDESFSTTVTPGWQEELALVRKELQTSRPAQKSSVPITPESQPVSGAPLQESLPSASSDPEQELATPKSQSESDRPVQELPTELFSIEHKSSAPPVPRRLPVPRRPEPELAAPPAPKKQAISRLALELPLSIPGIEQDLSPAEFGLPQDLPALTTQDRSAPLSSSAGQSGVHAGEIASTEQIRRELHIKVWEQEQTIQYPQMTTKPQDKDVEVAPPVADSLFSAQAKVEKSEQDRTIADLDTVLSAAVDPQATKQGNMPAWEMEEKTGSKGAKVENQIEDLPTTPLVVPDVPRRQPGPGITVERASTPALGRSSVASHALDEVEDSPTRPMAASPAPASRPPRVPSPTTPWPASPLPSSGPGAPPSSVPFTQLSSRGPLAGLPMQQTSANASPPGRPITPTDPPSHPGNVQLRPGTQGPQARSASVSSPDAVSGSKERSSAASPPSTSSTSEAVSTETLEKPAWKKKSVKRVLVALLVIFLVAGTGAYYVIEQPFTNSLAQVYQLYQNNSLGFSLDYPEKWQASVDQAHGIVHFADSSQTGQVELATSTASGQTLNQYLTAEIASLGITGQKAAAPVSFAGATWEQTRGSLIESGATYMAVLYVTQHDGRFYALVCLAPASPASVYAQMEQEDFGPLRKSFLFL